VANSNPREQLESQHNDVGIHNSDQASGVGQYPVVSDDQHVLRLQAELIEARTQIKKIVSMHCCLL